MKIQKKSKWIERKWLIGGPSFVFFVLFSILDANNIIQVPQSVSMMFGGITATWLITEGILDFKKIAQAKDAIQTSVTVMKEITTPKEDS